MAPSNRERMDFLHVRVNELAARIREADRETEYLDYLNELQKGVLPPRAVDEDEWNLLLPVEQKAALLSHYHTMRTELLELIRKKEEPTTTEKIKQWLESPWTRTAIAGVTLIKGAMVLVHVVQASGLFLRPPPRTPKPSA